jgi:hypothetical protein
VLAAAAVWLVTRVGLAVFTYAEVGLGTSNPGQFHSFLSAWQQYDTRWYLLISRVGYNQAPASAFFPLYPAVVGLVAALLGDAHGPVWPAFDPVRLGVALGVANLFSLAGFVGLALLAHQESRDERTGIQAVWALAAYPYAFFLAAAYSEGPFVAAAAFTLYFARRGSWGWAALSGVAASLIRPTGIALALPLAWEYGRQHDWGRSLALQPWRPRLKTVLGGVAVVAAVPLAVAGYAVFLWQRFGTPLIWFKVQADVWDRRTNAPWSTAVSLAERLIDFPAWSRDRAHLLVTVVPFAVLLLVLVVAWRRMPFSFVLYTLAVFYLAISAPIVSSAELIESAGRLIIPALPVFLILGTWMSRRPGFAQAWLAVGFLAQAALLVSFFQHHWVA